MGNSSLSNEFKSGKWQRIETIGNRQVLENIETKIQVQKHFAMSDFKSFDDRFKNTELYNWRKSLPDTTHIVKLYDYEIKQERFGIQEDQYVYTEKIHRLNQKAKTFSKPEAFLLMLDVLAGLDILFETFGLFNIDVFLFGLSDSGRGKVWINENYAKNSIDEANLIEAQNQTSELVVMNNLVRLVRDKVYNQTFMPEIDFPSNMYLKDAIQYIRNIRRQQPLFRVDKVYMDRNLFKDYYDNLYRQHIESTQPRTQPNPYYPSANKNLLAPPIQPQMLLIPGRSEPKQLQRQKSTSFIKVKKEPSETLSSDSNSRSKKPNDNHLPLPQNFTKQQHQQIHHGKIHLKDMIDKQKNSSTIIEGQNFSNQQFPLMEHNFAPNDKVPNQPPKAMAFQQRPMMPPLNMKNMPQMHQMNRQRQEQNLGPQFYQRPVNQVPEQIRGQQLIQRKIVEYRPLNIEERQNIQQLMGPSANNHQRFIPPAQNIQMSHDPRFVIQPNPRQALINPSSQTLPFTVGSRPLEPEILYSNKIGPNNGMHINVNLPKMEEQQFINDVQLCESVIFDRGQIERNMADL